MNDTPLLLASADRSDKGLVRTNNEDLAIREPARGIYGVIDGVGGHSSGELAAAIARRDILRYLEHPTETPARRVREAIAVANNEIVLAAEREPQHAGMACVLTLALIVGRALTIGHVGDTRCYKIRHGQIRKLTADHSPVGEMEDAGTLLELEAMCHPRRNEVFRDVGSAGHHAEESGFIDVVEETIEDDCAILVCSDGLTDGVASWTVSALVQQHAGNPQAVADALVAAANDAGGRDNVTVVYLEASGFAAAVHGHAHRERQPDPADVPTRVPDLEPVDAAVLDTTDLPATPATSATPEARTRAGVVGVVGRWILSSRATWLGLGFMGGVAIALLIFSSISPTPQEPRRLVVGGGGPDAFKSIQEAMTLARAGDAVVVEEGKYREQVIVKEGVDLVASRPGTVMLVGAGRTPWTAITARGPGRIAGLQIVSTAAKPIAVGITVSGRDRHLELLDLSGPMDEAISLEQADRATVIGSTVTTTGTAVILESTQKVTLANNTFVATRGAGRPALHGSDALEPVLVRNIFVGYGDHLIDGVFVIPGTNDIASVRDLLARIRGRIAQDNLVIPSQEAGAAR
jgi:PPM family protein phosphatase